MNKAYERASLATWWLPMFLASPLAAVPAEVTAAEGGGPTLVSPAAADREPRLGTACPTFSWAPAGDASGYELVVYPVRSRDGAYDSSLEPVVRLVLPAGASSWTPSLDECLAPGRYAWAVGALAGPSGEAGTRWSRPVSFWIEWADSGARPPAAPPRLPAASTVHRPAAGGDLRGVAAESYALPDCTGSLFLDVPLNAPFCAEIEQLSRDGITTGCGGGKYCPKNPVSREQMAAFLERAMRGTAHWSPAQASTDNPLPASNVISEVDNPAANVGQHTSITIGADGLPIVSFYDASAGTLKVAHCNDVACLGSDETVTTVDNPSNAVGQYTSIAIGADGLPIISYHDFTGGNLKVAHCSDVACAGSATITTLDDQATPVGQYTSIAIGILGFPIISYYDAGAFALKVAYCSNVACTARSLVTVDDPPANQVGEYTSIATGTDGAVVIAYHDATDGALKVAHCNFVDCAMPTITTVDATSADVGEHTSITIGADGLPIISYQNAEFATLKVAHCNDRKCTFPAETLTQFGEGAADTSITIGADGLPIVSYRDPLGNELQVMHCNDLACAGGDEQVRLIIEVGSLNYGEYNSITIGSDGLPVISYYDFSAGALKVVHCANRNCSPFFRRR